MKKNSQVIKIIFSLAFFVQAFSIFAQASSSTINENNSSLSQVNTTNETQGSSMSATASEKTVITIENAQSTTYKKDKDSGNDTIVLEGNVSVSVTKGATTTKVLAQKIVYDRNTQMLYASGGVSLEMTGATTGASNASASSLMLNTATLEGVFDDGRIVQTQSDALNLPSGSTLIVASKMFGKSQKNTITFKNGSLTFCDDENPHWHIRASRIWLLPGGEFAFLNALLFVGPVPVFYLPAFYYPKDELVFNPVFSYDKRRGHSIQTTAYLYGRKPLDTSGASASTSTSSSSDAGESLEALFNFMKPSTLKQQKLEGLVLHNLDENFTGDTTNYFKVMGDWYSNLGFLLGVDAVFKPNAYISNIVGKAQVAFTNTVVSTVDGYFPYYSNGKKHWDKSNFMGAKLPFRYGGEFSFSLSKPFSLSVSLPFYSDPFFTDDFKERSENMDWIGFLLNNNSDDEEITVTEISSFAWNITGSYSFPLPTTISPYLSTASISLNSNISFSSRANSLLTDSTLQSYSPERKFYYPSQVIPLKLAFSLSGTLFEYSKEKKNQSVTSNLQIALVVPDEFKAKLGDSSPSVESESASNSEGEKSGESKKNESEKNNANDSVSDKDAQLEKEKIAFERSALPALQVPTINVQQIQGLNYKLSYSATPDIASYLSYSADTLTGPEDFKWSNVRSTMYTLKFPISLTSNLTYGGSFFSMTNAFSYSPTLQKHPHISTDTTKGGYSASAAESIKLADYQASKQELVNTNTIKFMPFYYIDMFKNTSISYTSAIKFLRTEFIGDADNPEWKYLGPDWTDAQSITSHKLDFTYSMTEGDKWKFSQSLSFSMVIPPQLDDYTGTLSLTFPFTTFTFATGVKKTSKTDPSWKKKPLQQALSLSFFNNSLRFTQSYNYDLENKHHDGLKLSISWKDLQASYTMMYTKSYDFDSDAGWVQKSEESFLPYSFSFSYTPTTKTWFAWKNRISIAPGLSTSIVADLVRPTNSYFLFTPSLSFKINDFLTLTFSSTSRNGVLYRYVQKALGHEGRIPGETNIFVDLWNSFRFDKEEKRRASGFKLKSLDFSLVHELHDWTLEFKYKMEPRLITDPSTNQKRYDFSPFVSFSVVWKPMASMKTRIRSKTGSTGAYDEWEFD